LRGLFEAARGFDAGAAETQTRPAWTSHCAGCAAGSTGEELPSETTFSRAFAEFARSALPCRLHEALIEQTYTDRLVGHISRDATAIEAREKPVKSCWC
jgi:hypothetical protein